MHRSIALPLSLLLLFSLNAIAATHYFDDVRKRYQGSEAILLDRQGKNLHSIRRSVESQKLSWTRLENIAPSLARAAIGAEDRRFFEHSGVDMLAVGGAVRDYLQGKRLRGASTISMQLASILEPSLRALKGKQRSVTQKINQSQSALDLENAWSKSEILEAYLNLVPYHGELIGVTAASMGLFQKLPERLFRSESLLLASLIRSPNIDAEVLGQRACILSRYLNWSVACEGLQDLAKKILLRKHPTPREGQLAPHLAERLTANSKNWDPINTTIDSRIQSFAIQSLRNQLLRMGEEPRRDGAAVVLDNRSGEVLAYVGSVGQKPDASHTDAVHARRQAGPTLQPFLYASALQRRALTVATGLENKFHRGNDDSLYRSYVNTLDLVGQSEFMQTLRDLGISVSENVRFYGSSGSSVLASLDVSLWELTNAYRTLARSGIWTPVRFRQNNPDNQELMKKRRVFSFGAMFTVSSILADRKSRSQTADFFGSLEKRRFWSAVKMGTSPDMRDNWCIGYSDRYTVGVWTGSTSTSTSTSASASANASASTSAGVSEAPYVWLSIMNFLHQEKNPSRAIATTETPSILNKEVVRKPVKFANHSEIRLRLKGTEPTHSFKKMHKNLVWQRIVYPQPGMVIALDSEIPEGKQRVLFRSNPKNSQLAWRLNRKILGAAGEPYLWQPEVGQHELELFDSKRGIAVDSIKFDVR